MKCFAVIFVLFLLIFKCNCDQVSSKLDFGDSDENDSAKDMVLVAPKIQGVRVVVDTSKLKKSVESDNNENEDGTNTNKKNTKTVGIRTDITFEITDEDNVNSTDSKNKNPKNNNEDDSASVPVFKGTKTDSSQPGNGIYLWHIDQPIFHQTDDERISHGGSVDNWNNFIPSAGVWTTERNFIPRRKDYNGFRANFRPSFPIQPEKPWKPCLCSDQRAWKDDTSVHRNIYIPSSTHSTHIDDKLDEPFS